MLQDDFTIKPLCPFNQKWRRGQFYTMNIRGQEIINCFLFASRWQQMWLPVFTNKYYSRTNKLEGCRSSKFCYSLPNKPLRFVSYHMIIIPPTSKKLTGHIGFGLSVRSSRTLHARVLKFIYGFLMEKYLTHFFFLSELSPFLELCPFEKIQMKSDACHILWTVHAKVLKFHIWIPHGKIADLNFFSCPSYLPFWSYDLLKKSAWNLVSKVSQKVFELGAWNLVSL